MRSSSLTLAAGVEVTPYRAQDARDIRLTEHAQASLQGLRDVDAAWVAYESSGPAWTMRVHGEIVGCAGLILFFDQRRAHAWLLPADTLQAYPLSTVKAIVHHCRDFIDRYGLVRVSCQVPADTPWNRQWFGARWPLAERDRRFAQWLGFVPEGPPMERYGPNDEDYQQCVILQPREPVDVA